MQRKRGGPSCRSGTSFGHLQEKLCQGNNIKDGHVSHIQYVLGTFGRMKEEVNLFRNDSPCGGEVSDLSLYNSKDI